MSPSAGAGFFFAACGKRSEDEHSSVTQDHRVTVASGHRAANLPLVWHRYPIYPQSNVVMWG